MLFYQASAPTGWTAVAINDHALRVVTAGGTGGTTGGADNFSALFGTAKATASYTLTTADIPAHSHTMDGWFIGSGPNGGFSDWGPSSANSSGEQDVTTRTDGGSGGGHAHTLNNMNLRYADIIVATKD
jgi:hypothetical protein